jgi:16S rRNA (cytosine967-C5)-methyltransferase
MRQRTSEFTRSKPGLPRKADPIAIATEVIAECDATHPADAVLRGRLRRERGLEAAEARAVSQAVFRYFRWFGWLSPDRPLRQNVQYAQDVQREFETRPQKFSDEELVAKALPAWLTSEVKVSPEWVRSLQTEPVLWLRVRRKLVERVISELQDCVPSPELPTAIEYQGEQDLFRSPLFHEGAFEVQDLSSQVVGHVCEPKAGETWWDACAGEGGKLLHLSDLMENKGLIWASDRAAWRLQTLKRRTARAGVFNYRAVPWTGTAKLPTKTKFDGVLVDAPCSGVGTWQRNPHARWTTSQKDVTELKQLQVDLLRNAAAAVKPGGRLIYSVCTLTRSETSDVITEFAAGSPGFRPLPLRHPMGGQTASEIWIWPQQFQSNGMFIAGWQRET